MKAKTIPYLMFQHFQTTPVPKFTCFQLDHIANLKTIYVKKIKIIVKNKRKKNHHSKKNQVGEMDYCVYRLTTIFFSFTLHARMFHLLDTSFLGH